MYTPKKKCITNLPANWRLQAQQQMTKVASRSSVYSHGPTTLSTHANALTLWTSSSGSSLLISDDSSAVGHKRPFLKCLSQKCNLPQPLNGANLQHQISFLVHEKLVSVQVILLPKQTLFCANQWITQEDTRGGGPWWSNNKGTICWWSTACPTNGRMTTSSNWWRCHLRKRKGLW